MNIIVCIKQVPESNKVGVDPVTGVIKRDGADSKMNPYDLYAIETALRLRELQGGVVKVITMGPGQARSIILEAYSLGVDEGYIISDRAFAGSDVLATSRAISEGIKKLGDYDLIICGKQTTDGDTAQVGSEIAERLSLPSISNVCELVASDSSSLTVRMDMAESFQLAKISFPCLISVDKDIFQPRLPSYKLKLKTSDRAITFFSLADFEDNDPKKYGLNGSPTQVKRIFPPESDVNRELVTGNPERLAEAVADKLAELKYI